MAQSTIIRARNSTGATLVAGTVVYISGYDEADQIPTIAPADNRYEYKMPAIGVIRADIDNGEIDVVKINGPISSFDTSGAVVNDNVYVGENGGITFIEPSELDKDTSTQQIGTVRRVADYPEGNIQLFPLEVKRRISHPNLIDVLEDQHHIELHAETHRPNAVDQFIHANQHEIGGGDPIRHDLLTNLNSDVHSIYSLVDGTRAFTGTVGGITPTSSTHLTTKAYVDLHSLTDGSKDFTGVVIGVTPTLAAHLATKGYVDSQIPGASWRDPVIDKDLSTPPIFPSVNDRYIVNPTGLGLWSGHDNELAEWNGTTWDFVSPIEGYAAWVKDEDAIYVWSGSAWVKVSGSTVTGSGIAGQATFWSAASAITGDNDFFWDDTNKRLGIGTIAPAESLDISGALKLGTSVGTANGTIRWTGTDFEGRRSGVWESLIDSGTHAIGGASHTSSTLSALNALISNATLIDTTDARLSDARTPTSHAIGGSEHSASILATFNTKISDATLVDTTDARFSDDRTASGVRTATTIVAVSAATAPTIGQVLKATSSTGATWQDETGGAGSDGIAGYVQFSDGVGGFSYDTDNFFWDSASNYLGIGTASPEHKIHIQHGNPGGVAAQNTVGLQIEASQNAGISFMTPNTADNSIYFGDTDDNDVGSIQYLHSDNSLSFRTNGDVNPAIAIDSSQVTTFRSGASLSGIKITNDSTGDPAVQYQITGTTIFTTGVDNSDDAFKIGTTALATNTRFMIDSTGRIGIGLSPSAELLEISGAIVIGTALGTADGTIRWTGTDFEGRKSGTWTSFTTTNAHALGGAEHSADTLANLNSKISDATLIDTTDSRLSDDRTTDGLRNTTTIVAISAGPAPSTGQVLKANSSTVATWQDDISPGTAQTVDDHYQEHSEAFKTILKDLDGYASDQTVSEHYEQHSTAIRLITKDLDGYASGQTVSEHYSQHSTAIRTVIKSLDGYSTDTGLAQTVDDHYQEHSDAIRSITKDLDGYASDQTISEHYSQHSNALRTITKELDGYGSGSGVGDITGSGADGYVTFWTGEKTIGGSEEFYFNEIDGYLALGTMAPNERLTVDGALSMYKVPEPSAETGYGKIYINATNGRAFLKMENGNNIDLTAFDIDGGSFTDTFNNTNDFDAGTW